MLRTQIFITLLILLSTRESAFGAQSKQQALFVGGGVNGSHLFVNGSNGKRDAELDNGNFLTPYIGYQRIPRPFWRSLPWLRGTISVTATNFHTYRQRESRFLENGKKSDQGLDLGTGASGFLGYVNPTLLLWLGGQNNWYTYLGFGMGASYASINGSYYETNNTVPTACLAARTASEVVSACPKKNLHTAGIDLSLNMNLMISLGKFGFRYDVGGPLTTEKDKSYDIYNSTFAMFYQFLF